MRVLGSFITEVMTTASARDCIMGDINGRDTPWDVIGNITRRVIGQSIHDTQLEAITPQQPTLYARGRRASSTPELAITNTKGGTLEIRKELMWEGASNYDPIQLQFGNHNLEEGDGRLRRTSKAQLKGTLKRAEGG